MAPELHQVAGNLAMPGFTAPKLLWVRRHEPQTFSAPPRCCCRRIICATG
jgi:sugar (pentulose or hexulose) kinase